MGTFSYNRNIPNGPNNPSSDQPLMQTNTNSTQDLIDVDHFTFGQTGANAGRDGFHRQITMFNQSPAPALNGDNEIYTAIATGQAVNVPWIRNTSYNVPMFSIFNAGLGFTSVLGGVILQWGTVTGSHAGFFQNGDAAAQSFNTPFISNLFFVVIQPIFKTVTPSGTATFAINSAATNLTQFTWFLVTNSTQYTQFYWYALGI